MSVTTARWPGSRRRVARRAALLLAVLAAGRARAGDELHVEGTITSFLARDLDGDGRRELWVSHHENGERRLALFRPRAAAPQGPLYGRAPDRVVPVDPRAVMFAVGDFGPAPGGELVFLSAASGVIVPLADAIPPERLLRGDLFFGMPALDAFPAWLSREPLDLDGDGREDFLVPETHRLRVLLQRPGETREGTEDAEDAERWHESALPVRAYSLVNTDQARVREVLERFVNDHRVRAPLIDVTSTYPFPVVADFDGDGLLDIVVKQESYDLEVYRQAPAGTFRSRPELSAHIPWARGVASILLDDVDGDGRADLVATDIVLDKLAADVNVYIQDPRAKEQGFAEPRQVLRVKGIFAAPVLADADGDGRKDLLIASYRVDLLETLRAAAVDAVEISHQIYPAATETPFARRPEFQRTFVLSTRDVDPGTRRPYLFAGHDMTGDGRTDILWIDSRQDLRLYRGAGGRFRYEEDAAFRLRVAEPREVELVDLDGASGDEAVLVHERRLEVYRWSESAR